MYAFHNNGRSACPLRDEPVLFFDDGARRGIAIEAAKNFARHSAIGPLRTVFVNHVKKSEFNSRCRLPCHLVSRHCSTMDTPHIEGDIAVIEVFGKPKSPRYLGAGHDVFILGREPGMMSSFLEEIRRSEGLKRTTCRARSRRRR
jgi:hypothetical protein